MVSHGNYHRAEKIEKQSNRCNAWRLPGRLDEDPWLGVRPRLRAKGTIDELSCGSLSA